MPRSTANKTERQMKHLVSIILCAAFILLNCPSAMAFHADSFRTQAIQLNATVPVYLSAEVGMINGQALETVYEEGKGNKLSKLTWDIDKVMMVGMKGSADFTEWLSINAGVWTNLTSGDNGKMNDYDWDPQTNPDEWSDWYKSPVSMERAVVIDSSVEALLLQTEYVDISGMLGFKFDNWKWENSGGVYIYGKDGGWRNGKMTFAEGDPVIAYEQWYYCPYLGIQTDSNFGNFKLKTYVKGTIYAWSEDEDHHYKRGLVFKDTFSNMKYIGAGASASYSFNTRVFSTVSFDYQKYFEQYGNTKIIQEDGTTSEKISNGAGMGHESIYVSISLGLRF